jgi:hypothetical protein
MKITSVQQRENYSILVQFEDGTSGTVDLSQLVEKGIFKSLKDLSRFAKVYSTGYAVAWSDELEIDGPALYADITGKNPLNSFSTFPLHATD